ncbi:hypothetical protein [Bradyrhizobium australiense]|uniref:Uncharacterized protein n=1 Tax=Bradyrhizobium australiense TaxID=2721161 RepID=A0A7Y4LVE8_9BRAD|nr:hypothetical protein [Bradyrhizobium australiense]NOJ40322.1 hypothetical protein [Bradyrhizobium australiense]
MNAAPPGWVPHQIVTRLDGWIGAEDRIPTPVAEMIARSSPSCGTELIGIIRARMLARQRVYERSSRAIGEP